MKRKKPDEVQVESTILEVDPSGQIVRESLLPRLVEADRLAEQAEKRAELAKTTIGAANRRKKQAAEASARQYVKIAAELIEKNPRLRRATVAQLARLVVDKLKLQRISPAARTVRRALAAHLKK